MRLTRNLEYCRGYNMNCRVSGIRIDAGKFHLAYKAGYLWAKISQDNKIQLKRT